jgi:methionyl-tRNA formyltransferase
MNEEIDAGAVIAQKKVEIFPTDDSLKLYNRVQIAEKELLKEHLVSLIKGNYEVKEVPEPGNYNSISDFRKLCELDLDRKGTLSEHIDLLRALTHGDFNNAFFYEDGKKIFVKLTLETE